MAMTNGVQRTPMSTQHKPKMPEKSKKPKKVGAANIAKMSSGFQRGGC